MASAKLPVGITRITGKVALITGCSSGFGRATAERFVRHGADVVLVDLPAREAAGLELAERLGRPNAAFVAADVTSDPDVRLALQKVKNKFGRLDVAVNCAALRESHSIVDDEGAHDLEAFKRTVDVNLNGVFNVVRLAAALMNENDPDGDWQKGIFINAISDAHECRLPKLAALGAAHGGVAAMTLLLARDLATIGARVVSIAPSIYGSFANEATESSTPPWESSHAYEFARLAHNLVENPMINGAVIRLDGRRASSVSLEDEPVEDAAESRESSASAVGGR